MVPYVLVIILHSFNGEYRCFQRKNYIRYRNLCFSFLQRDSERGKETLYVLGNLCFSFLQRDSERGKETSYLYFIITVPYEDSKLDYCTVYMYTKKVSLIHSTTVTQ